MIDLILFKEYDELCKQVSFKGQMDCLNRVFDSDKLPPRRAIGSKQNEIRFNIFLTLMVEELRKEVK